MATLQPADLVQAKANTEFIERFANLEAPATTDRLGRTRKTIDGIVAELDAPAIATETYQNKLAAEAARFGAEAALAGVGSAGTIVDANFVSASYVGTAVAGTKRYAADELNGAAIGVFAEEASRNEVYDSGYTTNGGPFGLPTFWNLANAIGGLVVEILSSDATGLTFRIHGTAGSNGDWLLNFGSTTDLVVAAGEVWTGSIVVQKVAQAGVLGQGLTFIERNAGGAFVNQTQSPQDFQPDVMFPHAAKKVVTVGPRLNLAMYLNCAAGSAVDATYKILHPQLEKKAYPTAYIATPFNGGASRVADSLIAAAPTLFSAHFLAAQASRWVSTGTLLQFDDGTANNRVTLRNDNSRLICSVVKDGVVLSDSYIGKVLPMTLLKLGVELNPGYVAVSWQGKPAVSIPVPNGLVAMTRTLLGLGAAGAWGGTLSRYTGIAAALPVADLRYNTMPEGLFDDFDRADGAIGVPPTGQTYVQAVPWPLDSPAPPENYADIVNKTLATRDSGTTVTASYNCVDLLRVPSRMMASVAYSAGTLGGGNATLICTSRGMRKVADITDGSFHISFLDNQAQVQGFPGGNGNFVVYAYFDYPTACARDGATFYNLGWRVIGNGIVILMPGGSLRRVVVPALVAEMGRYADYESFWMGSTPTAAAAKPRSIFGAVAAY